MINNGKEERDNILVEHATSSQIAFSRRVDSVTAAFTVARVVNLQFQLRQLYGKAEGWVNAVHFDDQFRECRQLVDSQWEVLFSKCLAAPLQSLQLWAERDCELLGSFSDLEACEVLRVRDDHPFRVQKPRKIDNACWEREHVSVQPVHVEL